MGQDKKKPLYTLYESLKADNYDVPEEYESFERTLTESGDEGTANRMALYKALKSDKYDVPDTYESFANTLFVPARHISKDEFKPETHEVTLPKSTGGAVDAIRSLVKPGKKEDQPQLAAAGKQTQGWKPTEQQKIAISRQIRQIQKRSDDMFAESRERMQNLSDYYGSSSSLGFQTIEGKPVYNPETGKIDKTYLTPIGERTTSRAVADNSSMNFRKAMATADMSVGAQIRRAYAQRDDLIKKADKRRQEIDKLNNDLSKRPFIASIMSGGDSETGSSLGSSYQNDLLSDTEYRQYRAAIEECNQRIKTLENERYKQEGGDVGFWRGFGQTVSNPETWIGGATGFLDANAKLSASVVLKTEAAQSLMGVTAENEATQNMYGDFGFWNRAGVMTGEMLPFMLDFALTGGGFGAIKIGSKLATKGTTKLIGKEALKEMTELGVKTYAKKYGTRGIGRMAENWTIKALGTTADDLIIRAPLMTNTVQAGKTAADIVDRKLGDVVIDKNGNYDFSNNKTWGAAVWQGEANSIIENYSEMFGTHLDGVMPALAKIFGGKRISGMLARANSSNFGQILATTRKQFERLGVSDYFGEVGEEYYGQLWRTMLNLDDAYQQNPDGTRTNLLFTRQFHGDIWGGMALSMGLMGAGKYSISGIAYCKMKHQVNKADKRAAEIFTPDRWESIRALIDNTTNEDMGVLAENMVSDRNLSDDERSAVMEYMERSLNLRGNNLGTVARSRGKEDDIKVLPIDSELSGSYINGYGAALPQEMSDAQNMYEYQRQRLVTELAGIGEENIEKILADIENDPVGALGKVYDPALKDIILDYANAKAVRDGILQQTNDNIEEQIAQSDAMINGRINPATGMIQPVIMSVDDRQVYVVGGSLSVNSDGTIDREGSDGSIIVRDAQTGELEFTDPKSIVSALEEIDPEMERAAAVDNIRQQAAQAAANAMNGTLAFNPGDNVKVNSGSGFVDAKIIGSALDEKTGAPINDKIVVQFSDGTQAPFSKEELQAFADAANLERINNFEQERNATRAQQHATEAEALRPQFALNDEFTILNDTGTPIRGSITGELDDDGTVEIYTEEPINGNRVNHFTPAELEDMFDTYNGEPAAQETEEAGSVASAAEQETKGEGSMIGRSLTDEEAAGMIAGMEANAEVAPDIELTTDNWITLFGEEGAVATPIGEVKMGENQYFKMARQGRNGKLGMVKPTLVSPDVIIEDYRPASDGESERETSFVFVKTFTKENGERFYYFTSVTVRKDGREVVISNQERSDKRISKLLQQGKIAWIRKDILHPNTQVEESVPLNDSSSLTNSDNGAARLGVDSYVNGTGKDSDFVTDKQAVGSESSDAGEPAAQETNAGSAKATAPVADVPEVAGQSALSRIPINEKGEPIFEAADAETAWAGLVEMAGDEAVAADIANAQVKQATEALEALKKKQPKIVEPKLKGSPAEMLRAKQEADRKNEAELENYKRLIAEAQARVDAWSGIAGIPAERIAADEAERKRIEQLEAEEQAKWLEQKRGLDKRLRETAEKVKDLPEAVEILQNLEPQTVDEVAARLLSTNKLLWSDEKGVGRALKRGVSSHTGYGDGERRKMFGLFASAEKGGISLERLAEDKFQEECEAHSIPYDNQEALNALLDVLGGARTRGDITNYIINKRIDQAESLYQGFLNEMERLEDEYYHERYHQSKQEYEAYEENLAEETKKHLENFDEIEYYSNIAEDILNRHKTEDEYRRNKENESAGEVTADGRGNEVLSPTRPAEAGRGEIAGEQRTGSGVENRRAGNNPHGGLPESTSGELRKGDGTSGRPEEASEIDENGLPFVISGNGSTSFGVIREESGLQSAPIKLSEGYQDENGKGYGLRHIEAGHGEEIRNAGFSSVEEFVSYVAQNYDEDNIRVGKQRNSGNTTYLIQTTDSHDNTLFIELSRDGSYWNVNSGGVFRKGYSNKKETVAKTEPQQPKNAVSSDSSLSTDEQRGTSSIEPNGESTVSDGKDNTLPSDKQVIGSESSAAEAAEQEQKGALLSVGANEPTEAQKAAGNYKKEHRRVDGYNISIENAKGSVRRGTGADGKPWETTMQNDYGYIRGTEGVDGDHIDVFLSDTPEEGDVFVVDQVNEDGSFDEHKVMYGFPTEQAARDAYLSNYEPGWTGLGAITHISKDEFKKWIQSSRRKTKPFAEYKSVKPIDGNGMIGRSLTEQEATELIERMEANAEVAPAIELTPENWIAQFGEDGTVKTPIGIVKMGANQLLKLYSLKRTEYFGMIHPTLNSPDVILEEADPKEGSERDSKYLFIKTFVKSDGTRIVHFESVTVKKDGMEVSISSHEIKDKSLKNKMQNDIVLHLDEKLSPSSEMRLTETPSESEGPDLVPTSDNVSSDGKDNTLSSDKQTDGAESSDTDKPAVPETKAERRKAGKGEAAEPKIEDFGEKIAGARKDMLREFAKSMDNVTVQSLIELPLGKTFKRPNLKKMAESGVISDADATLAEAIIQGMILAKKKPALTRRMSSKRDIEAWAQEIYKGIRLLSDILSGDETRKEAAIARHKAEQEAALKNANEHIARLREWNPGKRFNDLTEVPDPIENILKILDGINYRPGDKVELPLTRIEIGLSGRYEVQSPGKQGALWFKRSHENLEDAIKTAILAAKLAQGDMDVEIPEMFLQIRGVGQRHITETGKFVVSYWGTRININERVFDTESEAKAFAEKKDGRVRPEKRYVNEYDSYTAIVVNPMNGEKYPIGKEASTHDEISLWMDENREEANKLALEAIYKAMGTKGASRPHFYVASTYDRSEKQVIYSVVEDDKSNPWPIVKDFDSREEAESWLKENMERLEMDRKARREAEAKVVYFQNSEGERRGVDRRKGESATPEKFTEAFGFRGVQFGNWTNGNDRQMALNQAYDAFMDMAEVLGLSPRAMSLDGELGLAFGARGNGSALAHYEPGAVVINLTKTRGAGSLAHEWLHALDNYLSRRGGVPLGHVTHGNGTEKLQPEVGASLDALMKAVKGSDYNKRSEEKGEYWGKPTEVMARLFACWINQKLRQKGDHCPFLTTDLDPKAMQSYQFWNYLVYRAEQIRKAERKKVEPEIMSKEEFYKLPESLRRYPFPTDKEVEQLSPYIEEFFKALGEREGATGSMAQERGRRYRKSGTMTGKSLFDWAEEERHISSEKPEPTEDSAASEQANSAIDNYAASYNEYLERVQELEKQLEDTPDQEESIREQIEHEEALLIESREQLREELRQYYVRNNTPEDAEKIARDMTSRAQLEVELQRNKSQQVRDIISVPVQTETVEETTTKEKEIKTAGGKISYNAIGHLPDAKAGEFAYVERQFTRSGEFDFTGSETIRDRGDVAYMFRALEDYSIEHVFAAFVKDGKVKIMHIGMGGPTMSYANLGAVRAGYDAFGADKIYLVHNHPSGNLTPSPADQTLMRRLEEAFDSKIEVEGLIVDTTSGRYTAFHGTGGEERETMPEGGGSTPAEVYRFDKVSRSGESMDVRTIHGPKDVIAFIEEQRFGDKEKVSYMVLSNSNEIIGNFHTGFSGIADKKLAEEIVSVATKYGGTRVVVYGNADIKDAASLKKLISRESLEGITLLDAVESKNDVNLSAMDAGYMREESVEYGKEGSKAEEVERTNSRFNEELQRQIEGTLPDGHVYSMGFPSKYLLSTGIPRLPIKLSAKTINIKANLERHKYEMSALRNLVNAIQKPWAIFEYGDKSKMQNLIIGIEDNGRQFLVGLSINPAVKGRTLEINSIRNVFPKNNHEWINWINKGLLLRVDGKEEIQAIIDKLRMNPVAFDYVDLDNAAKIVKNFENPPIMGEEDGEDVVYRTSVEIDVEYPNWLNGTTTVNGKHTTQVEGTRKTYSKLGDWIETNMGKDVEILDASSGMGYGTADLRERGFNIEDVEPYQSEQRKSNNPATYDSYGKIGKQYDFIISNAVLNVIPDDWRHDVLLDMVSHLKVGGRLFINTRKVGEENGIKDKIELDSPREVLVKRNGKIASYQRFFTPKELKEWVESELGEEYSVEIANEGNSGTKGLAAVVVTRNETVSRQGDGYGAYTDAEVSFANDPVPKVMGKNRFSKKRQSEFAARERQRMVARIQELAERMNLDNVEILTDTSQLEGKRATAKGFYNKRTRKITIVIPNNFSLIDAEQTLLHEAVAHYGLRKLFGEHFDTFLDNVYQSADEEIRRKIAGMVARNGWDFRTATEEYLAGLAEDMNFNEARNYGGWWSQIKRLFIDMLEKIGFEGFRDRIGIVITDNELRYLLWRSYENLQGHDEGIFRDAVDTAKQAKLKVGNYAKRSIEADYAAEPWMLNETNDRFNRELEQYEAGVLESGYRFELGMPSAYLKSAGFPNLPISMRASLLARKAGDERHPFDASDLKGLVDAIQKPIAILEYSKSNMRNLIVDVKRGDKHFLVGVTLNYKAGDIEINSVSGLFPKESHEWIKWIQDGKAIRIDQKEKVQAIIDSLRTNPAESERIGLNLDVTAKLVKNFKNPTIEEEELFRSGDFSPRDKAYARQSYERVVSSGSYQFKEAVLDSMLGLKELYKAISVAEDQGKEQNFRIQNVAGFENAYLFENRMSSMNAGEQHEYFIRYMRPLLREIGKIVKANSRKRRELTDYLMAKHGLERNEYMRNEAAANGEEINRDFAGLMGLTGEADWQSAETTARQWVDDYESTVDTTALWQAINDATKATLEKIYLSGIISKETYEKILGMYQYYIPLRGWDETTSEQVYGYLTSKNGPLGGSIMKKAAGRESMADDPIATISMMADDAIRQGNRNLMKQRFLNFILNHPSDAVSVHDIWLEYDDVADEWRPVFADVEATDTADEVAQKVEAFEQRMETLRNAKPDKYKKGREAQHIPYKVVKGNLKEHQILIKRNGRTFVATINGNPRAAQALNGLTNPDVDQNGVVGNILKSVTWINRQLSAFYTTRNPEFIVSNFFRDALYANCMTWVKESPRYALLFHKNFGLVNPIVMRRLLGKWEKDKLNMSNRLEALFYQFMKNGGETGYTNVRDIEGHKRAVAAELKKQGSTGRRVWTALGMQLDLLNRSAENCARFAAFVTSRDFGRSIDRAIYDAKEVSVNFNKKGSGGKMVNANGQALLGKAGSYLGGGGRLLYVFWNAGIQGFTNFGRQAKVHPAKFSAGATALFALGYVIPMLAQMLGDDDDKDAYYNLAEYTRRSNICFRVGGQWVMIPLPIEYRAMYGLGELAQGVISGNEYYSDEELGYQIVSQVSQIMPLDMLEGGGGISPFIPSAFKPFTEAYIMNKSWTGLPIYKDTPFNKNDPEWTKAYASADKHLVAFAKWLNETTDGDNFKKGAIDINPAKIEYMLNGTFGGVFTFPNKIKKTVETIAGNRDFEWRNIPIVSRLVTSDDERTANRKLKNEYFKYLEEYEETGRLMRKYENADNNGILGYAEKISFLENSPEYARWEIFDKFQPDIDVYRERIAAETNEEEKSKLEDEMYAVMRNLVNALHDPKKYYTEE